MKRFLVLTLLLTALILPVAAEQPAAEEYRQMFRSGNFYVEYKIPDEQQKIYTKNSRINITNMHKYIQKMLKNSNSKKPNYTICAARNGERLLKSSSIEKYPDALYRDGKYYRFIVDTEQSSNILIGSTSKTIRRVIMLDEDELYSPTLDPDEEWNYIREDLALPEELAVFYWNDPFRDNFQNQSPPRYNGSAKRVVKSSSKKVPDKEFDCDQYVNDIKNLSGAIIAQEVYNMLYEDGKLVRIQKYFVRDGKEKLLNELIINKISSQVPDEAFAIDKKFKLYSARKGDMSDLLNQLEQIGEIGGNEK